MPTDKKQTVKLAAAIGILLIVVVVLIAQRNAASAGKPTGRYYMNLATGDLVAGPMQGLPKLDAPDGVAVLAHVFTCGSCDESSRQVVYLETITDEALKAIANKDTDPAAAGRAMVEGVQFAAPPAAGEQPKWMPRVAPEAVALTARPATLCQGAAGKPCLP